MQLVTILAIHSQSDPVVGPPVAPIEEESRLEVTDRAVESRPIRFSRPMIFYVGRCVLH